MSTGSSNIIDKYSVAINEAHKFATNEENGLFSIGRVLKDTMLNKIIGFPKSIAGALKNVYKGVNDQIEIPENQKTLIGKDFSSLYESYKITTREVTDGSRVSVLTSKSSYSTEMVGDYSQLDSGDNHLRNYSELSDNTKAVYEITLMTKKFANCYSSVDSNSNDKLADNYADVMSQYQAFCEQKGMDWKNIVAGVSRELQLESNEYTNLSKSYFTSKVIDGDSWDNDRILANRSHDMLLAYTKEACPEYQDQQPYELQGVVDYESSFDTSKDSAQLSFLGKITKWGKDRINDIKNKFIKDRVKSAEGIIDIPQAADEESQVLIC